MMLPRPADSADPIITPDATVPPVKTVASTTGFSFALQFCVSVSDLHIADRIG